MKCKTLILVSLIFLLPACTTLEILDMAFDDDCIYRGTVEKVEHWAFKTEVTFKGGKTIECNLARWVDAGDWIEAREIEPVGRHHFEWQQCEFSR